MLLLDISNEYRHGERERIAERNKLLHPFTIMAVIEECCKCMKVMIDDGTRQPFTASNREMAEMHVRGRNGEVTNYNEIKHCPFCGKPIRIRSEIVLTKLVNFKAPFYSLENIYDKPSPDST